MDDLDIYCLFDLKSLVKILETRCPIFCSVYGNFLFFQIYFLFSSWILGIESWKRKKKDLFNSEQWFYPQLENNLYILNKF